MLRDFKSTQTGSFGLLQVNLHIGHGIVHEFLATTQFYGGNYWMVTIEGSLEVKLPTIWTDEKQSRAEAERRERLEERRSEEKESEERRCRCAKR